MSLTNFNIVVLEPDHIAVVVAETSHKLSSVNAVKFRAVQGVVAHLVFLNVHGELHTSQCLFFL